MPIQRELIYIDGKNETKNISSYWFSERKCNVVFNNSQNVYSYNLNRVRIRRTGISDDKAFEVFNYLKEISDVIGLKTEGDVNILSRSYQEISFVNEDSMLTCFLNGFIRAGYLPEREFYFFPFGFNLSQKVAVKNAFSNQLSVIEGPPGTGKTQTILNIIANAVIRGQTVAVVSNNNSATKSILEKLEKNGVGFIGAMLGSLQNKKEFIDLQKGLPDLSDFNFTETEKRELKKQLGSLEEVISEFLKKKNEKALLESKYEKLQTEFQHFKNTYTGYISKRISFHRKLKAKDVFALWISIENIVSDGKKLNFFRKFIYRLKYGLNDRSFYDNTLEGMVLILKGVYYEVSIEEVKKGIQNIESSLEGIAFEDKMREYSEFSMQLLKAELFLKFQRKERGLYSFVDLRRNPEEFLSDYPVILSTTYSLRQSLSEEVVYDFVIIDESSQVDLATGALALSCAKNAVIVGDLKQLSNVVDSHTRKKTDIVFEKYSLHNAYRFSDHSILQSIIELFPEIPRILLREHYRCHHKIIEFCNQKFYNNELIILSQNKNSRQPLLLYRTPPGNHAREKMNQRQIDVIKEVIIPEQSLEKVDLGIITPYRNQSFALKEAFLNSLAFADTVDKFQGREKQVIILSTVDNEISEFTDNPNRLNVAISRARDQLILLINGNDNRMDSNISDLIQYIDYNNFSTVNSNLKSIFDLLYKGYEAERSSFIKRYGRKSDFDSENLMYGLIKDVFSEEKYSKYDVLIHFPLINLFKNLSKLNDSEIRYLRNPSTHIDFLIYNKLSKSPILGIEVDGYFYHRRGTEQSKRDDMKDKIMEKYNFPLLRFKTNGSNEKIRLANKLDEFQEGNRQSKEKTK